MNNTKKEEKELTERELLETLTKQGEEMIELQKDIKLSLIFTLILLSVITGVLIVI